MALSYHVFIERAQDPSPEATARVAQAIASKYGLPMDAIAKRMAVGRFRVKANIDLPTAKKFAAALESLGAVCSVVDADTGTVQPGAAAAPAAAKIEPPPRAKPPISAGLATVAAPGSPPPPDRAAPKAVGVANAPAERTPAPSASSPLAGAAPAEKPASPPDQGYASGLSAAFGSAEVEAQTNLGAITEDTGSFSLATIDGADELAAAPKAAVKEDKAPTPALSEEAFLPPEEAEGGDKGLELAVETAPRHTPPPMPAQTGAAEVSDGAQSMLGQMADMQGAVEPLSGAAPSPSPASASAAQSAFDTGSPVPEGSAFSRARGDLARRPQLRFAAGVFVALLLGFIPAHVLAALRESSAYDKYREEVLEVQEKYLAATTKDELRDLGAEVAAVRREKKDQMESKRTNIAITGALVWALVGGGVGFVWFRKLDWDGWAR